MTGDRSAAEALSHAMGTIGFLRSVIASGESLSEDDIARINADRDGWSEVLDRERAAPAGPTLDDSLGLIQGLLDGSVSLDMGNGKTARLTPRSEWPANDATVDGRVGNIDPRDPTERFTFTEWVRILDRSLRLVKDVSDGVQRSPFTESDR